MMPKYSSAIGIASMVPSSSDCAPWHRDKLSHQPRLAEWLAERADRSIAGCWTISSFW